MDIEKEDIGNYFLDSEHLAQAFICIIEKCELKDKEKLAFHILAQIAFKYLGKNLQRELAKELNVMQE